MRNKLFACGCSDKEITEAEGWLKQVLPGLKEGEGNIKTGGTESYTIKSTGEHHEYEKTRPLDLTETLLLLLEEEGNNRRSTFSVTVGSDQWCGVSVMQERWDDKEDAEPIRVFSAQYDFGLLPYALAGIVLQIREEQPLTNEEAEKAEEEAIRADVTGRDD